MWDIQTLIVAVQGIQGRLNFHWYFQNDDTKTKQYQGN